MPSGASAATFGRQVQLIAKLCSPLPSIVCIHNSHGLSALQSLPVHITFLPTDTEATRAHNDDTPLNFQGLVGAQVRVSSASVCAAQMVQLQSGEPSGFVTSVTWTNITDVVTLCCRYGLAHWCCKICNLCHRLPEFAPYILREVLASFQKIANVPFSPCFGPQQQVAIHPTQHDQ